jgi:hypothetical protein
MIPEQVKKNLGRDCSIYRIKNDDIAHFFNKNISRTTPSRSFVLSEGDEVWSKMKLDPIVLEGHMNPKLECYMVNGCEIVSMLIPMSNLEETSD